ncbi:MAG: hypothetical protein ACRESJ_12365 [Pseudomonas sp.]|uniref:hypothetical protein n=1 Tax=Pseudomonas sp. TaxID=306 RepID=UPI003D6DBA91
MGRTSAGLVDKVKKQAQEGYEAVRDTVTKTTDQADAPARPDSPQNNASNASADPSRGLGTS